MSRIKENSNNSKNNRARKTGKMQENKENENTRNTSVKGNKFNMDYYTNMSNEQFEKFCERFITLHKTGVYIPPPTKPYICNNKKRVHKGPREYVPREIQRSTTFGQGRIGVSCSAFGVNNCSCCRSKNEPQPRILNNILYLQNKVDTSELYESKIQENMAQYNLENDLEKNELNTDHTLTEILRNKMSNTNSFKNSFSKLNARENDFAETIVYDDVITINNSLDHNYCEDDIIIIDNDDSMPSTSFVSNNKSEVKVIGEFTISDSENDDEGYSLLTLKPSEIKKNQYLKKYSNASDLKNKSEILLRALLDNERKLNTQKISKATESPTVLNKLDIKRADADKQKNLNLSTNTRRNNRINSKPEKKIIPVNTLDDSLTEVSKKETANTSTKGTGLRLLDCPICLESLERKELMSTICGHIFCSPCIQSCIRRTKTCPNCRKKLTLKSIHPIYI